MNEELVRAVALELFKHESGEMPFMRDVVPSFWHQQATRVLTAIEQAGYAVVPRGPTKAMLKAAAKSMSPERRPTPEHVSVMEKHKIRYQAMIAAAERDDG